MIIENLEKKIANQANLIAQLTLENEELYHQFNHLMIRNNKLLKRIDDQQKIIDDLHLRIEELHLINGNMLKLNDRLRVPGQANEPGQDSYSSRFPNPSSSREMNIPGINMETLYDRWKNYPGQVALNAPNLKKQSLMLAHLYMRHTLRANELFQLAGVGGVTGARYVSTLKKFGLIRYNGARKKGHYEITGNGISFVEGKNTLIASLPPDQQKSERPAGISMKQETRISNRSFDESDL